MERWAPARRWQLYRAQRQHGGRSAECEEVPDAAEMLATAVMNPS